MNKTRKMTEEEAGKYLINIAHQSRILFQSKFKATVIYQIVLTCICFAVVYKLRYMIGDTESAVNAIIGFNAVSTIYSVNTAFELRRKYKNYGRVIKSIENNEIRGLVEQLEKHGYNTEVPVEA